MLGDATVHDSADPNCSTDELNRALIISFFRKKFKGQTNPLKKVAFSFLIDVVTLGAVPKFINIGDFGKSFAGFVLMTEVGNVVKIFNDSFGSILFPADDPLIRFEVDYATNKRFIEQSHPGMSRRIEESLSSAQASPMNIPGIQQFLMNALRLPNKVSPIACDISSVDRYFDDMLSVYQGPEDESSGLTTEQLMATDLRFSADDSVRKKFHPLQHAITEHIRDATCTPEVFAESRRISRKYVYLLGQPSTGKTTLVGKIGEFLGLPVARVAIASSLDKLLGTTEEPGVILKAINNCRNSRVENLVLFLDEADNFFKDPLMVGVFKTIMDPVNPGYHDHYLCTYVSLRRALIVCAGNAAVPTSEDVDPGGAMKNRVEYIMMPELKSNAKKHILVSQKWLSIRDRYSDVMTPEAWEKFFSDFPVANTSMRDLESYLSRFASDLDLKKRSEAANAVVS